VIFLNTMYVLLRPVTDSVNMAASGVQTITTTKCALLAQ